MANTCGGGCTGGGALFTGILRCICGGCGIERLGGGRGWAGVGAGAREAGGTTPGCCVRTAMGDKSISTAYKVEQLFLNM